MGENALEFSRRHFVAISGLCSAGLLIGAAPGPAAPGKRRIIDVHLHAYPSDMTFEKPIVNPITKVRSPIRNGAEHMQASLDEMQRHNVVRCVVSGGDGDRIKAALEWRRRDPARVIAGAGVRGSDDTPLPPLKDLRQLFADRKLRVLGEVTAQYAGRTMGDPIYDPYLALAEEFNIPVAVHLGTMPAGTTFDPCCRTARASFGHPETLEEALNRHPKLRVNLMHSGWPYIDEAMAMMMLYDNVNIDTGALSWLLPLPAYHDYLRKLIDAGFADRVMFGTDQMYWPDAIGLAVERTEAANFLTSEDKDKLFFKNAAAFYAIETVNV